MDVRQYLASVHHLHSEIESIKAWLSDYDDVLYAISGSPFSEISTGKGYVTSRLENVVTKLIDREKQLSSELEFLIQREQNVRKLISEIENTNYRTILTRKYLDNISLTQIADEMHYSYKWIKTLHNGALQCADEIYKNGHYS